jgi:uncharacterized membrane protein
MKATAVRFTFAGLGALAATVALAGGPLHTFNYATRTPYAWNVAAWPNGQVPVYTDLGVLGVVSNARANELASNAAAQWSGVPTSKFRSAVVGSRLGDITDLNVASVVGAFNGGGIDIVYDADGSIMENFFGVPPEAVLGIADVDYTAFNRPEIIESWIVLSGPGIDASDTLGIGFAGVVTHEFGHAINLAHSQANGAVENPNLLDAPQANGCPAPWSGTVSPSQVETMYPLSNPVPGGTGEYMATVDRLDDMAALSDIYPAAGYPGNRGMVLGEIRDPSGRLITGVNVIARNVADPFNDFSSSISGQYSKGEDGPDGSFKLAGLTPGASYVLYVDNLLNGAFSVPRYFVALPGPEEYFNGAMESDDGSTDARCGWTTLTAVPGEPKIADITFNRLPGAPTFLQADYVGIPTDITPDGSVVVGGLGTNNGPVFRWDLNAGTAEELGGIVTGQVSISDDGTKIAANLRGADDVLRPAIYENGLWTALPPVAGAVPCNNTEAGFSYGSAYDISGDGSTVVGLSYGAGGCYSGTTRGFKWTAAGGTVQLPKLDTFDRAGRANAVNYDGTVIVGWDDASNGTRRGAQWRNGVLSLIRKGTNPVGEGLDVTRDGQYVVGAINTATSGQAWRYRPSSGVEQLGALPFQTGGTTNAISDDASVITGYSTSVTTGLLTAALWTSGLGFSNLNQLVGSQGISTEGGALVTGTAVSSDGRTIAGHMLSQFGYVPWVLKIPTVLVCHLGQTTAVSFPQGMDTALVQGDTLGPCQCHTAAPSGIVALQVGKPSPGTTRTSWADVTGATGYDLVRGGLSALQSSGGDFSAAVNACLENDLTETSSDDRDTPASGDGFWYLVSATTCGGHGTFDSGAPSQVGSRNTEIQASPNACP